jgi:subtilisin family serine protease
VILALLLPLSRPLPARQTNQPAALSGEPIFDAWVEFADKEVFTARARRDIYKELEKTFSSKALERRKKRRTFPGLFDERDIPLSKSYLQRVRETGAHILGQSRWLNGTAVQATGRQIEEIKLLPGIRDVIHIRKRTLSGRWMSRGEDLPPEPEAGDKIWPGFYGRARRQVEQLGLDRLHSAGFTGRGIIVAVVDTGFDLTHSAFTHPDHSIRIIDQWDAMNDDHDTTTGPGDWIWQHTHGTYVLGTIASYLPGRLVGAAYDASFILLKAEDDVEEYFLEEYWFVSALEYAEARGADIISSSLTHYFKYEPDQLDGRTSIMSRGWEIAAGNGVIGVQGAGNHGHDSDPAVGHLGVPADAFGIIAVGAVSPDGTTARFSSDGPTADGRLKPEVMAMGNPVWTVSLTDPERYVPSGGTSMAGPLIAGGIACLLQARPHWTTEELRKALYRSCGEYRKRGRSDPAFIRGYGIPNFFRAAALEKR